MTSHRRCSDVLCLRGCLSKIHFDIRLPFKTFKTILYFFTFRKVCLQYVIKWLSHNNGSMYIVLIDFLLTVKAATLIFISGRGSAISSAKQGKSGSIYNLVKNE